MCEAFSKGVHRVIVRCKPTFVHPSPFFRLCTQTDVARALYRQMLLHEPSAAVDAIVAPDNMPELITMKPTDTALNGYRRMLSKQLSALPVVDSVGMIVGTLSVSDLKYVKTLSWLSLPVTEFLDEIHGREHTLAFYATPQAPLAEVLNHLLATHYHRSWIVSNKKLIGVITLSDICRALYA